MVKGLAYVILGLITVGLTIAYIFEERTRVFARVDRRLSAMIPSGVDVPRRIQPLALPDRFAPLLVRAQVEITASRLRMLAGALAITVLFAAVVFGPILALLLLVGVPLAVLAWLRARALSRTEALIEAMPHYIDAVRQLQAVGASLSQAIERALAEAPEIVQSYFAPAARRLEMGAPVAETMQQLAERLQIPEISMLAAAIRTNLRYGGSISSVLRNLAHILRERARVRWELKAATSEARVSSRVLIAMPLIAMVMLVAMNPDYISFFFDDPRGRNMAMVAIGLECTGILVLRRLLRMMF